MNTNLVNESAEQELLYAIKGIFEGNQNPLMYTKEPRPLAYLTYTGLAVVGVPLQLMSGFNREERADIFQSMVYNTKDFMALQPNKSPTQNIYNEYLCLGCQVAYQSVGGNSIDGLGLAEETESVLRNIATGEPYYLRGDCEDTNCNLTPPVSLSSNNEKNIALTAYIQGICLSLNVRAQNALASIAKDIFPLGGDNSNSLEPTEPTV